MEYGTPAIRINGFGWPGSQSKLYIQFTYSRIEFIPHLKDKRPRGVYRNMSTLTHAKQLTWPGLAA